MRSGRAIPRSNTSVDWSTASCLRVDPEIFFPITDPSSPKRSMAAAEAIAVCRGCQIISECFDDALRRRERTGIRGGVDLEALHYEALKSRNAARMRRARSAGISGALTSQVG